MKKNENIQCEKNDKKNTNRDSNISVEMIPANEGDCILITLIEADFRILIDGGTRETYHSFLKDRLLILREERKSLDLLVVTHIDNDHIGGIIELLMENGSSDEAKIIDIKNIWHNSYRHLQFEKNKDIGEVEERILKKMVANGEESSELQALRKEKEISSLQGTTLAAYILSGGYAWNQQFGGLAVSNNFEEVSFENKCLIHILMPGENELYNLAKKWKRELQKSRLSFQFSDNEIFDDAFEFYWRYMMDESEGESKNICAEKTHVEKRSLEEMANFNGKDDGSDSNRSSVSFIIEYNGKKMLFFADNLAKFILELIGSEQKFDLIKMPHHGSINNISDDFIQNVETEKYLISTSSEKYGHPDIETLAKIACKRTTYKKQIFLNYRIPKISEFENEIREMEDIELIYLENGQEIIL